MLFETFKDFDNIFHIENIGHLLFHKDYKHIIDLVDQKQHLYIVIYPLSENELVIF